MPLSINTVRPHFSAPSPSGQQQQIESTINERQVQEDLQAQKQEAQTQQRSRDEERRSEAQERNERTIDVIV